MNIRLLSDVKHAIQRLLLLSLLAVIPLNLTAEPSGEEFYNELIASIPIYEDPELQAYIIELGERVVAVSEMAGEKFTFTLLDSPDLNAFATKGNYVYVNRGLLNYVSNEAQLISVIAHEVAHITQGHVKGSKGKSIGTELIAVLAGVLSGSGDVYEATQALGHSAIKGHGRANELEADEYGAVYMAKLGYDPREMLEMLSIMKDYEILQRRRAQAKGASSRQTYHGVFSTHPRNDARLRTAVTKANSVKSTKTRGSGAGHYRQLTDGLIWGENFLAKEQKPERYSNMTLGVRFDFPKDWIQVTQSTKYAIRGEEKEARASLTMIPIARTAQSPEEYLYNYLNIEKLKDGAQISPARLKGFTGILPGTNDKPDKRIAVVYYKFNAYLFTGEITEQENFEEFDKLFLQSINTFRPISKREIIGQRPKKVHYVKATDATTFDALAKSLKLSKAEAEDLRLINGYYPAGEPKPGEWIKIFKQ